MTLTVSLFFIVTLLFGFNFAGPVVPVKEPEVFNPYNFGYQMDNGNGTTLHRQETANEDGAVKGSYGYEDANGFYRQVEYQADKNGYHAKISSNEPGVINQNSADAIYYVKLNPSA